MMCLRYEAVYLRSSSEVPRFWTKLLAVVGAGGSARAESRRAINCFTRAMAIFPAALTPPVLLLVRIQGSPVFAALDAISRHKTVDPLARAAGKALAEGYLVLLTAS
jgi:hypothetical protein